MSNLKAVILIIAIHFGANQTQAAEAAKLDLAKESLIHMTQADLVLALTSHLKKRLGLTTKQIEVLTKNSENYQLKLKGVPEEQITDQLNALIVESGIEGAEVINRHDPLFWLYRSRFGMENPPAPAQVPAWLTRRGHGWHVYLADASADPESILKRGDQIKFKEGLPFDFEVSNPKSLDVLVKSLSWDKPQAKTLRLQQKSVSQILLELTRTHHRIVVTGKTNTGILPMPAIDLEPLRLDAEHALKNFQNTTDQLIVDLRGPYGGGGVTGIELFLDDKGNRSHYKKPLYLLIDRFTSGGRELLAGLLQRHANAVLIGEPTAGRTDPVELTELEPAKFILITEHTTKKTSSGSLNPDRPIAESLMFAAGQDNILEGALVIISKN